MEQNLQAQLQPNASRGILSHAAETVPPHAWFIVSAVFHYLGPAFAVLLFDRTGVLGMAWLRIATAAMIFALMTRPWRTFARADWPTRRLFVAFGTCLALMNCSFYLALDRLPISLVAAMEFAGTVAVALAGMRSRRNLAALAAAIAGTLLLIDVRWASDPAGLAWAFANCVLFVVYIVLGHRLARTAGGGAAGLGVAMAVAFVVVFPVGVHQALPTFQAPALLLAAVGVGICSSVIPYVCDQLAMARLPRASFALLLAMLPLTATLIGALVLRQVPGGRDLAGIALVMIAVAAHRPAPE